jgi:hypothetical protein
MALIITTGGAGQGADLTLSTIPAQVYKQNDGVERPGPTESWLFDLLVREEHNLPGIEPASATVQLFSGPAVVKTVEYSASILRGMRGARYQPIANTVSPGQFAPEPELFDIRFRFSEPVSSKVDRIELKLDLRMPQRGIISKLLTVPIASYIPKTKLVFPLRGNFVVVNGGVLENGHGERSQQFAYDILALGPHFELIRSDAKTNADFIGWGRRVISPADGTVTYARNDVPDNPQPEKVEKELFLSRQEPMWAVGGNCVVIDHGNGEFSFLAHLQKGSVQVKKGDHVTQQQMIGLLGNSGNSDGPHLHYHLMAGPTIFRSDGLPSRFSNTDIPVPKRGVLSSAQ